METKVGNRPMTFLSSVSWCKTDVAENQMDELDAFGLV